MKNFDPINDPDQPEASHKFYLLNITTRDIAEIDQLTTQYSLPSPPIPPSRMLCACTTPISRVPFSYGPEQVRDIQHP
jgi:hypothetical protein